jgi:hypothetical protein
MEHMGTARGKHVLKKEERNSVGRTYRLLQLEGNSASVGVLLLIAAVLENISVLTLAG